MDQFILSGLKLNDLKLAVPATKEQLIRRVTFGLIGLPPTVEKIDAFVSDHSADAWLKLIDRLLASPHYGKRWARHWLDVARYAESDGFDHERLIFRHNGRDERLTDVAGHVITNALS